MAGPGNDKDSSSVGSSDDPPSLSIALKELGDLPNEVKRWSKDHCPVDILLLTLEDCEFLACYHYLRDSFKSYKKSIGYVYFGKMGEDEDEALKVALVKCSKDSSDPGGSQTAARNAVTLLRPKATFLVGFCYSPSPGKTRLGDVVISLKLTTDFHETPVSRDIGNLVRTAAHGWKAPLENPKARKVKVHCDGEILSCSDLIGARQQCQLHPGAIAVEMERKGLFATAHDMKMEWLVVKGVCDFLNGSGSTDDSWKNFACVMAASVVSNMLSNPFVFEDWPHYGDGELNIKVEVEDLKLKGCYMQTTTIATETGGCQRFQYQRAAATSPTEGSTSLSGTEDRQTFEARVLASIAGNYLRTTPPQSDEEHNRFLEFMRGMNVTITGFCVGSLLIAVKCESLQILEELWTYYSSGHLGEIVQNCFVTEKILEEMNLAELKLKTTIDIEEYKARKVYFERDAPRADIPAEEESCKRDDPSENKPRRLGDISAEESCKSDGPSENKPRRLADTSENNQGSTVVPPGEDNKMLPAEGSVEFIAQLQQMQLDASKVNEKTDLKTEMKKTASDKGFRIVDNEGSGNCMFYALSDQLEIAMRIKIKHDELRQRLVQYLRKNPRLPDETNLFNFVHGHQSWADYLTYMEQDGAWGDHVILGAAANCYKTCIRVVSSLSAASEVIVRPQCPVDKSRTLVLGHIHEVHYVSLHSTQDVQAEVPSDSTSQFDDATLKAIAEVYLKDGDNEYSKGEAYNAVHLYTEGLQVNCKDIQVNAALYSNRAAAQLLLGNYQEALDDATVSVQFEPTFIKAIENGASACEQLHFYQEAIGWCQKGLAMDHNNKKLLDLWTQCVTESTDGTDESGSKQEVKTNRDKNSAESEDIKIHKQLSQTAIKKVLHHENNSHLSIKVEERAGEGNTYGNLVNAYDSLGDFQRAIQYHERRLKIAKEVGDKAEEGKSYCNLGITYRRLGDFQRAIQYHELHLKIAKEVGDKAGEGKSYGNLGNAYGSLGDFQRAIQYHERHLQIAKEVGDKAREGKSYGNLGITYRRLGDFQRAIQYHERDLQIAKEVGDKAGEGSSYCNLGCAFGSLGDLERAANSYLSGIVIFEAIRTSLRLNDDWKISYRDMQRNAYNCLWRLRLKQNQIFDALLSAEQGRAQALNDLICFRYGLGETQLRPHTPRISDLEVLIGDAVSNTVFMALDSEECKIFYWFINSLRDIQLRSIEMSSYGSFKDVNNFIESLINTASREFTRAVIKCENRSLDEPYDEELVKKRSGHAGYSLECSPHAALRKLYDVIIEPVADLVNCNELTIVPESSLWLVPFAALMDSESNYLCDSFRVRMIPSLTTLKLINDYPNDFHNKKGALLVGDPCLEEVLFQGRKLDPLPCAREEVTMIGRILGTEPLIGEEAKKDEVLRRLPFVALVHFAAHGRMETGEIALAPSRACSSQPFGEEESLLTMKDVLNIQIRAKLVVLSCCHSARGEIKAEGVVGIARAFLGAGARSVLVSLWAIDDGATLEFMKHFYEELVTGKLASEALNQAMRSMKKSEKLSDVKYWAPFVLIGDDVSLEFH